MTSLDSILKSRDISLPTKVCLRFLLKKTTALCTFVSKVMSLLFNTLSRFVITFLPRSKRFLVLWLQSLSAMILEPKEIKSVTVSTFSPSIYHELMGPDAMILVFFWMLSFKPAFAKDTLFPLLLKETLQERYNYYSHSINEKAEPQWWLRWLSNMTPLAYMKAWIWTQGMRVLDSSSRDLFDKWAYR